LPLVVMLHGCTQNPDDFAAGTGMNDAALAQGFFVLYPAQTQQANAQRCWNWFKHTHQQRDRGEPALLAGMVRSVMRQHRIDPRRVYVAGLSAGGAMAAILGDAYPELFAAVGVHSGLATGSANDVGSAFAAMKSGDGAVAGKTGLGQLHGLRPHLAETVPARPVRKSNAPPTIVFHGDRDNTVHPANGERVVAAAMEPGMGSSRATPREPQQQRARSPNGRHYTRTVHRDESGRTLSEHWVVHGAGHAWSGGRAAGSYTDPQGPDATAEMLRFFLSVS
jgi:poly(hydroxyalkanoate) depolymerase family esterase